MPSVSVIIPTYNRQDLVPETIDSILKQDFTDYEIIVVDDGSTDSTFNALQKFGRKIEYIYQPHSGVSKTRNTGIKTAKGNYITFLDSDDLWLPEKLSIQLNFLKKHPDAYICYTKEKWLRNNSWVTQPQVYEPGTKHIISKLLKRCFIGASSVIIRKKLFNLIGYFDESMPVCEDLDLWLRVAINYPIYFINEPLTIKRMGQWPQLSTDTWGMDRYRIYTLEKLLKNNNLTAEHKKLFLSTIHQKASILAKGSLKHKRFGLTLKYGLKWLRSKNTQK